jgi:hypothetical protein
MKRYVAGLGRASASVPDDLPDGLFLVRVERAQYRWHTQKPYYGFVFSVLEPKPLAGTRFTARLYCTPKALWKLNWFLRDFGYDSELLGRDEIDDKHLVGLSGVVKISHAVVSGTSLLHLEAFAPAGQWQELSAGSDNQPDNARATS